MARAMARAMGGQRAPDSRLYPVSPPGSPQHLGTPKAGQTSSVLLHHSVLSGAVHCLPPASTCAGAARRKQMCTD